MTLRLGILTTHPIQYQVPWFRLLSSTPGIDLQVLYCFLPNAKQQGEGFEVKFEWDIPLLNGYEYRVLHNIAKKPSVTQFEGCNTPEIHQIVQREHWDAFIVNGWVVKSCLQLLVACRRFNIPCLVRGESNAIRPRSIWKALLLRLLLSQYNAYLSIGKSNYTFYRQQGVNKHKIFPTPYCIDNDRFQEESTHLSSQSQKLKSALGLKSDLITFLFCGKFTPKKRPLDLLSALLHAKETGQANFQILMVGDGELRTICEKFVSTHQLPVVFSGFLNQKAIIRAYVASDCLVLPSDYGETWGLVVNEAMACGLPAIVSNQVGCHPDLIRANETGEVYETGNVHVLSNHLINFAKSGHSSLKKLGSNARKHVTKHYSYRHVVEGIKEALRETQKPGKQS